MHSITDLNSLLHQHANSIIYSCVAGSRAYGTDHANSDEDIRGIYILPAENYLSIVEPPSMLSDDLGNTVYYSLHRFIQLAANANPNILELLFMPADCNRLMTAWMETLISARELFITKQTYISHIGYAQAQIKKARGQNKWVNNPQSTSPPCREEYCWVVLQRKNNEKTYPFRPVSLSDIQINLSECHVASLEHCPNVYRLYSIGKNAKGVFRNGNVVCESISKNDEIENCIGLLIFNKAGYECALKDFNHYWQWMKNRNEHRWQTQESGVLDYDAKNMMHMFRLLLSGENILRNGSPVVRFQGADLEMLRDILNGKYQYVELINMATDKINQLAELNERSKLPDHPDINKINTLLHKITRSWESTHA